MLEDVLSLAKWKKKKAILSELKEEGINISERELRKKIVLNNQKYAEGIANYYIAHSNKGYKLTVNWEDIEKSIKDNRKRALTMLSECKKCEEQFQRRNNLKFEFTGEIDG